jgi:hypothetical protein
MPALPRRPILLVALAALAVPSSAEAANACRARADHAKVVAQSSTALVYSTGKPFNRYVSACTFKSPRKTFRLPGQDGGDTNTPYSYRLNGRFLAYAVINQEEASPTAGSTVYSVDLTKRRRLIGVEAGDPAQADNTSTEVKALVVGAGGAVAWITDSINLDERLSLRKAAHGAAPTLLDHGNDLGRRSLALSADGKTIFWTRAGAAKMAALP